MHTAAGEPLLSLVHPRANRLNNFCSSVCESLICLASCWASWRRPSGFADGESRVFVIPLKAIDQARFWLCRMWVAPGSGAPSSVLIGSVFDSTESEFWPVTPFKTADLSHTRLCSGRVPLVPASLPPHSRSPCSALSLFLSLWFMCIPTLALQLVGLCSSWLLFEAADVVSAERELLLWTSSYENPPLFLQLVGLSCPWHLFKPLTKCLAIQVVNHCYNLFFTGLLPWTSPGITESVSV